jgi:hypothetical protein
VLIVAERALDRLHRGDQVGLLGGQLLIVDHAVGQRRREVVEARHVGVEIGVAVVVDPACTRHVRSFAVATIATIATFRRGSA